MEMKVRDLTTEQLRFLVSETVKETIEGFTEDMLALSSREYLNSIAEARKDYKEGRVKNMGEVLDV